jgi:hypothetical protein
MFLSLALALALALASGSDKMRDSKRVQSKITPQGARLSKSPSRPGCEWLVCVSKQAKAAGSEACQLTTANNRTTAGVACRSSLASCKPCTDATDPPDPANLQGTDTPVPGGVVVDAGWWCCCFCCCFCRTNSRSSHLYAARPLASRSFQPPSRSHLQLSESAFGPSLALVPKLAVRPPVSLTSPLPSPSDTPYCLQAREELPLHASRECGELSRLEA